MQAIDPEMHRLIEEGPQQRRRYLDWGVFHVEPRSSRHWQRFQRALGNETPRYAAEPPDLVRAWDAELIEAGARVAAAGARYLEQLQATCGRGR